MGKNNDLLFGLRENMTEEQILYEGHIMNNKNLIVICDSLAGTGKTTIAVACAKMLVSNKKHAIRWFILHILTGRRKNTWVFNW